MQRTALKYLLEWQSNPRRKPLVIRGARQVGKSYLVNMLAEQAFTDITIVDFEFDATLAELFTSKDPTTIIQQLELKLARSIVPGKTLLFLDEIQASPEAFASLRYFYEKMPELHVIAAGSLLEFALKDHTFSMPVGRIEYLYLSPMSFEEYLATTNHQLLNFLQNFQIGDDLPNIVHNECLKLMREYFVLGGMPETLKAWLDTRSFLECEKVQQSILTTYRDDFSKYGKNVNIKRIQTVYNQLPFIIGKKMVYSQIDRHEKSRDLKASVELLKLAKVIYNVHHTSANGIPLRAEASEKAYKPLLLDIGLLCQACGLNLLDFNRYDDILLVNSGALCEQFVGQQLLANMPLFKEPELFYWMRENPQSAAEVDFVIAQRNQVIPVEVKAGKTGSLKSMHRFLYEKERKISVRFNSDIPSIFEGSTKLAGGGSINYKLISLPLYMSGQLQRLLVGYL